MQIKNIPIPASIFLFTLIIFLAFSILINNHAHSININNKKTTKTVPEHYIKGVIQSLDTSKNNSELTSGSKLIIIKTDNQEVKVLVNILNCKIIGGYEKIKEGIEIKVYGVHKDELLVATKAIIKTEDIKEITDYKELKKSFSNNNEFKKWISQNSKVKGIYHKNYNNKDYILIAAGACNTGGYSIKVNGLYKEKDALYIDAKVLGPAKGTMVTQAITYPYLVLELSTDNEFTNVTWF